MTKYMIIAKVGKEEYLSKVNADSELEAEHMILDRGIAGRHEYAVDACMAYDARLMKTDTFIGAALFAEPISIDDLMVLIDDRNAEITRKDAAEEKKTILEKRIKELDEQRRLAIEEIANLEKILRG